MKLVGGIQLNRVLAVSLAAALLISSSALTSTVQAAPAAQASVAKSVNITWNPAIYEFDGMKMMPTSDELGFLYNNSTYVPLRFVSNSLNKAVQWDQKTKTVTVADPSAKEKVLINEYQQNAQYRAMKDTGSQKASSAKISVQQVGITYLFDGAKKKPSAELPGLIYKDRVYVPMRFMGESLGQAVSWDKANNAVVMMSKEYASSNDNSSNGGGTTEGNDKTDKPNVPGIPSGSGKATYAEIVNKTERTLRVLENDAQSQLYDLLDQYKKATTTAEKDRLRAEGEKVFTDTTTEFNKVVNDTSSQLSANGHSTAIIKEYEVYYQQQVEFGKKMLENMKSDK